MGTAVDTETTTPIHLSTKANDSAESISTLRRRYSSLFESIREGAVEREQRRELPFLVVEELRQAGFTKLRVPVVFGGGGESLETFFELLLDLAAADSNVAHLLRGHIAYVENLLLREPDAHRDAWLQRIGSGALIGNASSERQELTEITTVLEQGPTGLTVTGTKYYTTGSIYADWISLSAVRDGERFNVLVRADDVGLKIVDDWDGFGQQLTASGSMTLNNVKVDESDITGFDLANPHLGFGVGIFQTTLLAVAAGIAQAAVNDAVEFVKPRRRTFANPGELAPRDQDLVQNVIGESAAKAYSARLIVAGQVRSLAAYAARAADGKHVGLDSFESLQEAAGLLALEVFNAQHVVLKLALETATEIFEVGGASATSTVRRLDRHWRNARTVASHNPTKYRSRAVGEYLLTGELRIFGERNPQTSSTVQTQN